MNSSLAEALNGTEANDEFCRPQADWNFTDRCDYVRASDSCGGGGYLQWTAYVYCDEDEIGKAGGWFIVAAGIIFFIFLFLMLSTSADDFFCPNLSTIVNKLRISENLAGVTFMAFGNGAPDVFTSLASVVSSPSSRADLALGALLGGAMFVTLVVLSGVILMRPFKAAVFSTLRDLAFFMVTIGFILLIFLVSDEVHIWQPLVCLGIYATYVLTVLITEFVKKRRRRRSEEEARAEPETANTPEATVGEEDLKHFDRLNVLRMSPTNVSRRSVVIPSFTGNAHEIVIEDAGEESADDFIIRHQEAQHIRHKTSINHKILHGARGVIADLRSYFAPQFEDDEPSRFQRVKTYFLWPIVTLFKLTVPLSTSDWSKPVSVILAILSPQSFLFNTQLIYTKPVEDGPGLYAYAPIVSIPLILFILFFTTMEQEPRFYKIFYSLAGFVMSVSWMYCISNEVVDAVTMIGVVTGIDQAILGLTVISWANCVGDLVSDSSVARQGFPRMGMAAATGGPLFNVLIGFGLPFTIAKIKGDTVPINLNSTSLIMIVFMFISLIFTAVNLIIFRGLLRRAHGILLIAIYISFLVFVILSATGVLVWVSPN